MRVCSGNTGASLIDLASVQVPLKQMPGNDMRAPQVTQFLLISLPASMLPVCVFFFCVKRGPGARRWHTAAVMTGQGCDENNSCRDPQRKNGEELFLEKSLDARVFICLC